MLKFRYLFNNPDLALMLLKNWEFEAGSEVLFQHFRISANAIYPFRINGDLCFLRFCPLPEKNEESVQAELAFLKFLNRQGYPALEIIPSRTGAELVKKQTPWGEYVASVLKGVRGKQISQTDFGSEIMIAYGAALGELHAISTQYSNPGLKRWTHSDVFDWIEKTLRELGLDQKPWQEMTFLRREFDQLTIDQENYGLIHYDFEPDNVFYDETSQRCSVIDFDDTMYHWFVMDVFQALDAIRDETGRDDISDLEIQFLGGYQSKFALDDQVFNKQPLFRRFARLYQYTRVANAMQESWDNEPDWMNDLRKRLTKQILIEF